MSDYDMPCLFSVIDRKARKEHECCECHRYVMPGEFYQVATGLWEHEWAEFKTCHDCVVLRERVDRELRDTPPFGELIEWAREAGMVTF